MAYEFIMHYGRKLKLRKQLQNVTWFCDGEIQTNFIDDPRIYRRCLRCGESKKFVFSFVNSSRIRTESHILRCAKCRNSFGSLPHKVDEQNVGDFVVYFGKHKGQKLSEIPVDYLKWCAENLKDEKIKTRIKLYLQVKGLDTTESQPQL